MYCCGCGLIVHCQILLTDCIYYFTTGGSTVPHWCDANSSTLPCIRRFRTLDNFSVYKRTNATWWSQPFYTSVNGYKLQLRVDANGEGSGTGSILSLFVFLMNDDKLSFQFNAKIIVQIEHPV